MTKYRTAWLYYEKFIQQKTALQLNIYPGENVKIAFVLLQMGRNEEAEEYLKQYLQYAEAEQSIYRDLAFSAYYATLGQVDQGMKHLKAFAEQENYTYWLVLFLEDDPIIEQLSTHPEFRTTIQKIQDRFWAEHKKTKQLLNEKGVI